ncbi:hypothetical protein [Paracoccus marcusii]|uniref:hypothetical protein n=1 Tax=Paracoccus marcusii TaxID=59779 RepID=UPI0039C88230
MIARRVQDRGAHARPRQGGEDVDQLLDGGQVQRVALGRAVQGDAGDALVVHRQQDVRQPQIRDVAHVRFPP